MDMEQSQKLDILPVLVVMVLATVLFILNHVLNVMDMVATLEQMGGFFVHLAMLQEQLQLLVSVQTAPVVVKFMR